jgi:RNA polymerase sigma-70 factor (ECF subfamily)
VLDFNTFYKEKFADLTDFAKKSGFSDSDAEDIAQNVLIDFWRRFDRKTIDLSQNIKAYLYQRARWRIVDAARRRKDRFERFKQIGEFNDLDDLPSQEKENTAWKSQLIKKATKNIRPKVSDKYYAYFIEQCILNKSAQETAEKYKVKECNVHLAKHRVGKLVVEEAKTLLKNGF